MKGFKRKTILFVTNYSLKKINRLIPNNDKIILKYYNCNNKNHIKKLEKYLDKNIYNDSLLLSFSNSYIFKKRQLDKFEKINKINFHPGLPEYPGRDVSHFACYNNEREFGGTMHSITKKIDNGNIIELKKMQLNRKKPDHSYFLNIGHKAICYLLKKNFSKLLKNNITFKKIKWSQTTYTRKKFLRMLHVKNDVTKDYLEHLRKSFYTPQYPSLYKIKEGKKIFIKFN